MLKTIELGRYDAGRPVVNSTVETPRGSCQIRFDLARPTQRYIYDTLRWFGHYERDVERELMELQPDDVFFDVGAHCGYFSAIAATMIGPQRVTAFEPHPDNFADLMLNCPNSICVRAAVSDTQHPEPFYRNLDNDGGHALWNPGMHDWNLETRGGRLPPITVSQTTLDQFAPSMPTVIKIDTEGAELRVLRGAANVLNQPQLRTVICELNHFGLDQMGDDEESLRRFMATFGFKAPAESIGPGVSNLIFKR